MPTLSSRTAVWILTTAALATGACGSSNAVESQPGTRGAVSARPDPASQGRGSADAPSIVEVDFAALEAQYDTRLGVYVLDTETDRAVAWRAEERFPFASSVKAALAGAVLDETPKKDLERVLRFTAADLVPNSPVSEQNLDSGLSLREAIDATLRFSDNTAANLLFDELDGPAGFDRALDRLGDQVTDPERTEPDLNTAIPGDTRDTSSPQALATTTAAYVLGQVLPRADRNLLRTTMIASTSGDALIGAGVPATWVVADKTGGADYGVRNDVGVAYPPGRAPVLIAVMSARDQADEEYDDAVVADATRLAIEALELG